MEGYLYRGITLNKDSVSNILDGTMNQVEVNKHLLTAIVTVINSFVSQFDITNEIIKQHAVKLQGIIDFAKSQSEINHENHKIMEQYAVQQNL